jgi:cupin fold WbuC family metalloprotein
MQLINNQLLDGVTSQAQSSPRLRKNYNFHETLEAKSQRLLNALEPGTILPIHRHTHTSETYVLLRGKIKVLFYNDKKEVIEEAILDPLEGNFGVNIPKGQWHTLEVIEKGSVIFECKDGPYQPIAEGDVLR